MKFLCFAILFLTQTYAFDFGELFEKYYFIERDSSLNKTALGLALKHYDKRRDRLRNPDYLSVVDFTLFSGKRRFYLIDMNSGKIKTYHVAHGRGGDKDDDGYADSFSNKEGSWKSSLGLYQTDTTYWSSKNGYSLKLDGLSKTNSRARKRYIVVHGADYVQEGDKKIGLSKGCLAFDHKYNKDIIDTIKGGSLIFAWVKNQNP